MRIGRHAARLKTPASSLSTRTAGAPGSVRESPATTVQEDPNGNLLKFCGAPQLAHRSKFGPDGFERTQKTHPIAQAVPITRAVV